MFIAKYKKEIILIIILIAFAITLTYFKKSISKSDEAVLGEQTSLKVNFNFVDDETLALNSSSKAKLIAPDVDEYSVITYFLIKSVTDDQRIAEEDELKRIHDEHVSSIRGFILKYGEDNTDFANTSGVLLDNALKCGADYKMLLAISAVESGLGRLPINKYNPFGFIDNTRYHSYDEAVKHITCDFAKYYTKKGLKTVSQVAKKYNPANESEYELNLQKYYDLVKKELTF